MEDLLKRIYYDPSHPAGFSSIPKLSRAVKDAGFPQASHGNVRKWLATQEVYATSMPSRKIIQRSPILDVCYNGSWEMDLIDMTRYGSSNGGYRFILICIDSFSRFLITRKCKTKTTAEVSRALENVFKHDSKPLFSVRTDAGKEFLGNIILKLYKQYKLAHFISRNSETKCSKAERVIQTWKRRAFKYFHSKSSYKWTDVMQDITHAYNNSVHRSLGQKPCEINTENQDYSRIIQYMIANRVGVDGKPKPKVKNPKKSLTTATKTKTAKKTNTDTSTNTIPVVKPKFKIGDYVRISSLRSKFARAYSQTWSEEIYVVKRLYLRGNMPIYILQDLEAEPLVGTFYQQELSKADKPEGDVYTIDKILKERKYKKTKQYFVSWLGWHKKHNSWVNASDIKQL